RYATAAVHHQCHGQRQLVTREICNLLLHAIFKHAEILPLKIIGNPALVVSNCSLHEHHAYIHLERESAFFRRQSVPGRSRALRPKFYTERERPESKSASC